MPDSNAVNPPLPPPTGPPMSPPPGVPTNPAPRSGGRPEKPDNYLLWAILTTVMCCWPFGIVSIVFSAKVDGLWAQGQWAEAQDASDKAKKWAIVAAASMLVYLLIAVAFFAIGEVGSGSA